MLRLLLSLIAIIASVEAIRASTTIPRPPAPGRHWGEDAAASLLVTVPARVIRSVTPSVQVKQIPPPPEASATRYLPHTTPEYEMQQRPHLPLRLLWATPEFRPTPAFMPQHTVQAPWV